MTDDVQKQFAALGVAVEVTETEDEAQEVWPENWRSLTAWLECETQWRVVSTMRQLVWMGLDYVAVKVVLDAEGYDRAVFEDLRTMEGAALPFLNEGD